MEKLALFICFVLPVFGGSRVAAMSPPPTAFAQDHPDREPPDKPAIIRILGNRIEFVYNGQSIFKGEITSNIKDVEIRQLNTVNGVVVTQMIKLVSHSGEPISIRGAVLA